MKVKVPPHATARLLERSIDIDNAKKVIKAPSNTEITFDGRIKSTATLGDGRILTVVYRKLSKNKIVIITGYYGK